MWNDIFNHFETKVELNQLIKFVNQMHMCRSIISIDLKYQLIRCPISEAICQGNVDFLQFLMENSIDLTKATFYMEVKIFGETTVCVANILHLACYKGNKEVVEFVLNRIGRTLINSSMKTDHLCDDYQIAQIDVKMTPLYIAMHLRNVSTIKLLIQTEGINLNIRDVAGRTPLEMAIKKRMPEVELLIREKLKEEALKNMIRTKEFSTLVNNIKVQDFLTKILKCSVKSAQE